MWVQLIACHGGADKAADDSSTDAPPEGWQIVAEGLPGAVLSVSGSAPDDVWFVGADADDGEGPALIQWDGAAWTRHDAGSPGDLWWAWRAGSDAVWVAGAGGRVVRYTPSAGASTVDTTDPAATLFGLWGSGPDDVYAVGGNVTLPTNGAQVWHYDGEAWSALALPAEAAAQSAMYKVWGTGPDDVWVCGLGGVVIRWDGEAWATVPTGTTQPLFTVHGTSGDDVWAVGGAGNGVALHWDGDVFTDLTPDFTETLQGVFAHDGGADVVGWSGNVLTGDASGLAQDPRGRPSFADLHAVWADADGTRWLVGGDLGGSTLGSGVVVRSGAGEVPGYTP